MTKTENTSTAGYICKSCGAPSPVGVGYAVETAEAATASANLTHCECGYSVHA